ncbi:MAG: UDP-N-acetylmuramoyl-L-alanine--D-glutamate ligase, partial [Clostridia bacterium]|nr:UDP-N-acetylmuramoyl-L-alanine--D-glutamate ligase [Clostridia bacterium]
ESVREVATTFRGVAHRMEYVRTVDGVRYYNSSIDSTPTRTVAVLSSLGGNLVVICGGADKNLSFEPLAEILKERAKIVILTGNTRKKIYDALEAADARMPIFIEADFKKAVLLAKSKASAGDTVVLSPACTSFDAFRNFEERGETFRRIVSELEETENN